MPGLFFSSYLLSFYKLAAMFPQKNISCIKF
jgi:hypothetical protein